jgi:hypothetical protein
MGYVSAMDERDPSFFTGLNSSDFVAIGIAFMFSLGGLYLIWRMLFGPPLFEPAIQAQIKAIESSERPTTSTVHTGPGEVAVGISPGASQNRKKH